MYSAGIVSFVGSITVNNSVFSHNINNGTVSAIATTSKFNNGFSASLCGAIVNFSLCTGSNTVDLMIANKKNRRKLYLSLLLSYTIIKQITDKHSLKIFNLRQCYCKHT